MIAALYRLVTTGSTEKQKNQVTRTSATQFFGHIKYSINAWRIVDAYVLCADPLSYAQPHENRE